MMQAFLLSLLAIPGVLGIWPKPESLEHGNSILWLSKDVKVQYNPSTKSGIQTILEYSRRLFSKNNLNARPTSEEIIQDAIERTYSLLFEEEFVPWMFHERNSNFEPSLNDSKRYITSINIQGPSDSVDDIPRISSQDESYSLHIHDNGTVTMTVSSSIGVVRALDTFTQLFYTHSNHPKNEVYTTHVPLVIHDRPRFHHRGLNLDVARNWYPLGSILRTIDIMSWNKLNILHLHITDSQSWPLEIPSFPELAEKGAFRKGFSYSPQDIQHVQRYAALRGIEVLFEVDMPGHTSSIAHSFPDLITAFNIQPNWEIYAAEPPSGQLKLNSSAVDSFVGKILDDLLPRLKSEGGAMMFHTGGDEINLEAHLLDDTVRSNDPRVIRPLLQSFVNKVHDRVRRYGLIPVVWEEMLLDWNLELGKDVIVQTWRSQDAVKKVVERGYRVIAGDYRHWYLDCGYGTWLMPRPSSTSSNHHSPHHRHDAQHHRHHQEQHNLNQQPLNIPPTNYPNTPPTHQSKSKNKYSFQDYCSPYKSWPWISTYDPLEGIPSRYHDKVLGAEVHLWSELTDPSNLDGKLWPRGSVAAEVLWRGGGGGVDSDAEESKKDDVEEEEEEEEIKMDRKKLIDTATRLSEFRARMVQRGVNAEMVIMEWCLLEGVGSCTY